MKLVSNDSRIIFLNRGSCGLVIAASSEMKKREDKRQPIQFSFESSCIFEVRRKNESNKSRTQRLTYGWLVKKSS